MKIQNVATQSLNAINVIISLLLLLVVSGCSNPFNTRDKEVQRVINDAYVGVSINDVNDDDDVRDYFSMRSNKVSSVSSTIDDSNFAVQLTADDNGKAKIYNFDGYLFSNISGTLKILRGDKIQIVTTAKNKPQSIIIQGNIVPVHRDGPVNKDSMLCEVNGEISILHHNMDYGSNLDHEDGDDNELINTMSQKTRSTAVSRGALDKVRSSDMRPNPDMNRGQSSTIASRPSNKSTRIPRTNTARPTHE